MPDNYFFGFDECKNNIGQVVSTFSNLSSDKPSNLCYKANKNEMRMRFFLIGKTYKFFIKSL